jgi:hypothetical protein
VISNGVLCSNPAPATNQDQQLTLTHQAQLLLEVAPQGNLLEDGGGGQKGGRPSGRGGGEARDSVSNAGTGLGAEQAGGYFADRGRDEAQPSYGCFGGVAGETGR